MSELGHSDSVQKIIDALNFTDSEGSRLAALAIGEIYDSDQYASSAVNAPAGYSVEQPHYPESWRFVIDTPDGLRTPSFCLEDDPKKRYLQMQRLRQMQLGLPETTMLNSLLDKAVVYARASGLRTVSAMEIKRTAERGELIVEIVFPREYRDFLVGDPFAVSIVSTIATLRGYPIRSGFSVKDEFIKTAACGLAIQMLKNVPFGTGN